LHNPTGLSRDLAPLYLGMTLHYLVKVFRDGEGYVHHGFPYVQYVNVHANNRDAIVAEMGDVALVDLATYYITGPGDWTVKIHRDECRFCVNRRPGATTTKWSQAFPSLAEAERFAKPTRKMWGRKVLSFIADAWE
jgi:hypothetical protein